jgi:hypothetical protein
MGEGYNFEKFKAAILDLSKSKIWEEAKPEWELYLVYEDGSDRACECGHQPIHQICVIKNRENQKEAEVGNVCVHKFMQLASKRIFSVLRRVANDLTKSLNPAALDMFCNRGVISHAEQADYSGYWRKRNRMTDEERAQKLDINQRVISYVQEETQRMIDNFKKHGLKPRI